MSKPTPVGRDLDTLIRDIGALMRPPEQMEGYFREQELQKRRDRLDAAKPSITGEDYDHIVADTYPERPALRAAKGYAKAAVRGGSRSKLPPYFTLWGGAGRGKTVAACWVLAHVGGMFVSAAEWRRLFYSRFPNDAERYVRGMNAGLLLLDDLGRGSPQKDDEDVFFPFFHERQRAGCHTIITTNHSPEQLRQRYGEFIADRLEHAGEYFEVEDENLRRTFSRTAR